MCIGSLSAQDFFFQSFNYSVAALFDSESNTESPILIARNVVRLGKKGSEFTGRDERLRAYSSMLHICALKGSLKVGKGIHGHVIKNGINPDARLWNSLVVVYAKWGSHQCGRQLLDDMPKRDVVSWTALISGLIADGYYRDGIGFYCVMRRDGVRPNGFSLATALKGCSMYMDIGFGKQVHAEVIKIGFLDDIFVGSSLVGLYAKCDEMELANRVFLSMPEWNAVSWSTLLHGYAQMGEGDEVLRLFSGITELETRFSCFILSTVLKGCSNSGKLREAQSVHSMVVKVGVELDQYVSRSLLNVYSIFGRSADAFKVFARIRDPNVFAWSQMINSLNGQGQRKEAAELFCQMGRKGIRPNQFTLSNLVSAATDLGDQKYGESIHACICKCGFESDNFITNALVVMYMKLGSVQKGFLVFDAISDRDLASWNALLSGFDDDVTGYQGPRIFKQMLVEGLKPDMYTFCSIARNVACLSNVKIGKQVHAHIVKNDLSDNTYVGTPLVNMYAKNMCMDDAGILFHRLRKKDVSAWTAVISGYAQNYEVYKAMECFSQMQQEGLKPNEFALSSCLSGCSNLAALETGKQFHSLALKLGISRGTYVTSALVDMYVKCSSIEDAEAVFKNMAERSIVMWNTIICGYSLHGYGEKALEAFWSVLDECCVPNDVTFIGVLSACSRMGLVEEGKKHFKSISEVYGITPTTEHYACMVNILCRAGKFHEVVSFIDEMKLTQKTLIWETVLWASKMHGSVEFGQKAAGKLFELDPKMDYVYVMLSGIFAAKGRWDDGEKVRASMAIQGIKKEPGCSWVKTDTQVSLFFAQDCSDPEIKEICLRLGEMTRCREKH